MKLSKFCDKYGVATNAFTMARNVGSDLADYTREVDGLIYVDEKAILEANNYRKRVWNDSHDLWYLLTRHLNASQLGRILSKVYNNKKQTWTSWFHLELFAEQQESVTYVKPQEKREQFLEAGMMLYVIIKRHLSYNKKIDFKKEKEWLII